MSEHYPDSWWLPVRGRLTRAQLAIIGSAVTEWSVLDIQLQLLLCELAQSPDTLGQALTSDLGPDNRLKALERLVRTWRTILRPSRLQTFKADLIEVEAILRWVKSKKSLRNKIAHWAWIRSDDNTIFGFKFTTQPLRSDRPSASINVNELRAFADEVNELAYRVTAVTVRLKQLPTFPRGVLERVLRSEIEPGDEV